MNPSGITIKNEREGYYTKVAGNTLCARLSSTAEAYVYNAKGTVLATERALTWDDVRYLLWQMATQVA